MSKFAKVVDGVVVEPPLIWEAFSPADVFGEAEATLYHSCPDEVVQGWLFDGVAYREAADPAAPAPTAADVDFERDRRIISGFVFGGVLYQSGAGDRENIAGAKSAASDAIALGVQAGDLSWQQLLDPSAPAAFAWIAADNSLQPMDAQTVVQLGYAALRHKQAMIFAARALKDIDPIPADYADDSHWPA